MYSKNKSGQRIDPCGTPHVIVISSEMVPLYILSLFGHYKQFQSKTFTIKKIYDNIKIGFKSL